MTITAVTDDYLPESHAAYGSTERAYYTTAFIKIELGRALHNGFKTLYAP
ncbi:MAG TPA: hypothetical protein VEI25_00605 [Paraburkholderia sp.]|nr:hypothetical protein [Paraburkholderia sp.]